MSKYGLTVMLCLLLAGGVFAGQTGAGLATIAGAPDAPGLNTAPVDLDPTRAPEGKFMQAPQESYQQDAVTWSTRAVYPTSGTYRGHIGAWERQALDSSFYYAVGGQGYSYYPYNYRYNSRTNTWAQMANMPVGTSNQCAVYWRDADGSGQDSSGVFSFGTYGGASNTNCYYWRKSTNTWTQVASYSGSWYYGNMAAVVGDSAFLMTYNSPTFQRYSIRQNAWATRTSPSVANYFGAMTAAQGRVYQVGGWSAQTTFQEYNPLTGTWTNKAATPSNVGGNSPNIAPWDTGSVHRVYVWNGANAWTPYNGVAWWDANSNTWTTEGTVPEGVCGAWSAPIDEFAGPIKGINHACGYNGSSYITTHRRGVPDVPQPNDVGVTKIISPADPFYAFGDTLWFKAQVKNFGTAPQTNVPVVVTLRAKTAGNVVFTATENVPSMAVGQTCTLNFAAYYAPPAQETVFIDTMKTALVGDGNPVNNALTNNVKVTEWGSECLTYNDGTFDNAISWVAAGNQLATLFVPPMQPLPINKAILYISSFSGSDYAAEVRIYGNDGNGGSPGTLLGAWVGNLHSSIWTSLYKNEVFFDPAISVAYDSFFCSYYQTSISPAYPYLGMDYTPTITTGNDWGTYAGGAWATFPYDTYMDFGIDACYQARLLDGTIVDITAPAATIDSGASDIYPQIVVKNAGLKARSNIPVSFTITPDDPADPSYYEEANSGPVGIGQEKAVDFVAAFPPQPGTYVMTGVSNMPYDTKYENDTLSLPLFVRYYDVKVQIMSPRRQEVPGLVPVTVKLTNIGNVPVMVPRVDVTIAPAGYADYRENIAIAVGSFQLVTLNPWVCPQGSQETAYAWITDPSDMNAGVMNDNVWCDDWQTAVRTGIPGWTEMTPLPAPPSGKPIKDGGCMAYDMGTDKIWASKGNKTGDFYVYDVNAGSWTNKKGIPLGAEGKQVGKGSVIAADGAGKLYLTKGNNTIGFWGYEAGTDAWTQLTNVPTGSSGKKVKQGAGLAWATKAGVGSVYLLKGYRNEFHKYNPLTNSWTQLLDAPIGTANHLKWDAGSWLVADADAGNMLYAFKAKYHEFYTYDTDADTWSKAKNAMPIPGSAGNKKAKDGSTAAWYNGKIYAFKGGNTVEFWRYFPLGDSWKKQDDIPLIGMTGARKKVKAGAALAGYPGTGIYGFKGNKSLEFWRYTPYDVVGAQPRRDGVTAGATEIGSVSFAIAPNPLSGGFATVRYSLPKAGLATLNVFDVAGRTVLNQTIAAGRTGTASLDLRKLEAGVYLVKVTAEGFSTTQKLVVEH